MKGLALETIAYYLLAIITIIIIIALIYDKILPFSKSVYCTVLRGIKSILPLPEHLKTSLPVFCEHSEGGVESIVIHAKEPDEIAREIAVLIVGCWEKTGKLKMGKNFLCFEASIKQVYGNVTEDDVVSTLTKEGYPGFPLVWKAGEITSVKVISIGYDATLEKIIVQ